MTGVAFCPVCNLINETGVPCDTCRDESAVSASHAVCRFSNVTPVQALIQHFKYKYIEELQVYIGELTSQYALQTTRLDVDLVLPVPLHPRRYRERGFNQSEIIGRYVAEWLEKPLSTDIVRRHRYTRRQVGKGRRARIRNLEGAFSLVDTKKISGQDILLIDDVYTSGATMQSLARTLERAGAGKISALTLAKG